MSNRNKTIVQMSATENPATFNIAPFANPIGNVRINDCAVPNSWQTVDVGENDYFDITMIAGTGGSGGTVTGTVASGNYQDRQALADQLSCIMDKSKTGFGESIALGWLSSENRFVCKSIKFAVDDPLEEYPLTGDNEITINNVNPLRNIFFTVMGYLSTDTSISAASHKGRYTDLLYKRQYLYVRSAELATLMTNNNRLEIDGTSTPPGGKARCIFLLPIDQDGTTGRVCRRFLGDVQSFYPNVLGQPPANNKNFGPTITLDITDSDGNSINFNKNSVAGGADGRLNKWTLTLRFDDVEYIAAV